MSKSVESSTVYGLLGQAIALDLKHPHAWERLGEILDEAKRIQEAVATAIDEARFQARMTRLDGIIESANAHGREARQGDEAGAPEGPVMHPAFGVMTQQFMAR